jgi:hypothetical protein
MRRTRQLAITGVAVAAACFTGACGHHRQNGLCVDNRTHLVVDQRYCNDSYNRGFVGGYYGYYYGGRGRIGQAVSGGTYVDPGNRSAVTSRGGFGSSSKSGSSGTSHSSKSGSSGKSGGS